MEKDVLVIPMRFLILRSEEGSSFPSSLCKPSKGESFKYVRMVWNCVLDKTYKR